ncbi:uncharacterized protein LOC118737224 [Rhagoletis pomonella]|uniref:uncharacterized protein LOC118737224 n=1 Tax=Rhagoletis pomonella TaxID=28610 RepID=UPI001785FEC6|nr:uncharacterized protein LOC118737224 [Rhagoletis pomonella]
MDLGSEKNLLQVQNNPNESRLCRKRRHSDCGEQHSTSCEAAYENGAVGDYTPAAKCRGVDSTHQVCLTDFPDELLYEIFKSLDSWTYYALMNCCNRFCTLLMDRRFWQHIDLSQKLLPLGILEDVMERTHKGTTCVKLRGPSRQYTSTEIQKFNKTLADTFAQRCTQLNILELRGVTVDLRNVRIVHFPKTLKRLVFRDCNFCKPQDEQTIFSGIHTHLVHLEELGIEYSSWFEPYYIMMISKIPSLRWLSLKGCSRLGDFIPYGSMAARFGFKKLEYLDLRFTPITDSDLQCFNVVLTLKELLLDCPLSMRDNETKNSTPTKDESKDASDSDCQPSTSKASTSPEDYDSSLYSSAMVNSSSNTSIQEGREETEKPSCSSPQMSSSSSSTSSSSPSSALNSPFASPSRLPQDHAADNSLPEPGGNFPSRSRFLPRPEHVILLDFVNRRPTIRHIRPPPNVDNHFDLMLQHPHFWNIINPLGRGNESNWSSSSSGPVPHFSHHPCCRQYPISDRGICCFGRPQNPVEPGVIWIRIGNRPSENSFVRLSVRNYKKVTDISLHHLVQCSPDLIYLDLSGTSVTREGVQRFKASKPECQIIADHLIGSSNDDCPNQEPIID